MGDRALLFSILWFDLGNVEGVFQTMRLMRYSDLKALISENLGRYFGQFSRK